VSLLTAFYGRFLAVVPTAHRRVVTGVGIADEALGVREMQVGVILAAPRYKLGRPGLLLRLSQLLVTAPVTLEKPLFKDSRRDGRE
jgi:hypothetical protein